MATKKKNAYYYEYDSSITFRMLLPKDPEAIFDIGSKTVILKEVPGLTWFLRAKQIKIDLKKGCSEPTTELRLTLTPSPGITPANLSYSVEGAFQSKYDEHDIVTEGFQPLPYSQASQKLMFTKWPGYKQSNAHQSENHGGLDSILKGIHRGSYVSFEVKLTVRSPKCLFFDDNIANLLNDIASPKLADFTFRVGNSDFKIHKHILAARSPVFCAMLANTECLEVKNSEMTIIDATEDALEMFLKFLYNASMPVFELSLYMEALVLAEKYQVMDLKKLCELKIAEKIKINDPVHEIYQLAFTYNCSPKLKTKCFDLIEEKFFSGKQINPRLKNEPEKVLKLVNMLIDFEDTFRALNSSVASSSPEESDPNLTDNDM